jgi:hypothetical protein
MEDNLKKRIFDFLKSQGEEGAMLDDLMEQPSISYAGRPAVTEALEALKKEEKIVGVDPVYGYRYID